LAATVGAEAAFTGVAAGSMVAAGSTVGASVVVVAFTAMAAGASAEGMAVFGEASAATAEGTGGMAGAGVEVGVEAGVEAGVGVDSVGPTSDLDSIPGPIGPDRTLATTIIPIIRTTGVTILTRLIPAIPMATARPATIRMPIART